MGTKSNRCEERARGAARDFWRFAPVLAASAAFVAAPTAVQGESQPILLDPLTVTARQFEEPIQKVPFGISARTAEVLQDAGIEETRDLFRSVPNFNFTDSGLPEANLLNMRGIGSSSTFLSPSVTYYVDGVPVPQRVFDQRFLDVERVEILRGPQGTLFGQNSQAGAVSIVTADPTENPEFEIGGEYGNFDTRKVSARASGPITQRLSGRVQGQFLARDGDIRNFRFNAVTGDETRRNIREQALGTASGKLQLDAGDDTTVILAGRFQRDRQRPTTGLLLDDPEFPRNALDPRPENDIDALGGAATLEHFFGDTRLTSVTGFQAYDLSLRADITDGFLAGANTGLPPIVFAPANAIREIDEDLTQWSQELRLDGETDGGIRWVAGVSGLYSNFTSATDITSPVLANGEYEADIEKTNLAAFGEVTVPLNPRLRVVGGLRVSHEENDFDGRFEGRAGGAPAAALFEESGHTEDSFVTGRTALSYDLTPEITGYVTVARGEKAGGFPFFNQSAAFGISAQAFDSSATWSYEAGVRGQAFDRRVDFSAAVFFNDTTDEQLFIFNPIAGQFAVENADTESYGAELEVTARPLEGFSVTGSLGLLQTRVTDADDGSSVQSGNEVPYAPSFTASLAGQYLLPADPIGLPGDFFARAEYLYVGSRELDPANSDRLEAYDLVNLRLGLVTEQIDVYGFVSNLFNEEYEHSGFFAGTSPGGDAVIGGVPGMPRTFGVGARVRF